MKHSSKEKGFSLVEVLISILILGVVAAFIAIVIPTSATLSNRTDNMESTTASAQKYIEEVKAEFAADPSLFDSITDGTDPPITVTEEHTSGGKYSITTSTSVNNTADLGSGEVPVLITLQVTVAPTSGEEILSESDQAVTISAMLRRDR